MIVTLGLRAVQLVFAAIVLALSVVLINNHGQGKSPTQLPYAAFCGGLGLVVAAIGVGAIFFEKLQGIIMSGLDALTALFMLAGGITYAVSAKVGSCTNKLYLGDANEHIKAIFSTGLKAEYFNNKGKLRESKVWDDLTTRCRMVQADTAFLWFLFACFVATAVLGLLNRTKSRGSFV